MARAHIAAYGEQAVACASHRARPMAARRPSERTLLATYRKKRRFEETPEPANAQRLKPGEHGAPLRFVIQKHHASRLHYDFRLEADGVLKSWAVPKGPSLNPDDKRLAMQVEDHPLDYFDFEGVIPAGNYGAGEVIVWDWGTYALEEGEDVGAAIEAGKLKFRMDGTKMKGGFTLVRMHGKNPSDRAWLLFHEHDAHAKDSYDAESHAKSVKSGHTLADVKSDAHARTWTSNRPSDTRQDHRHAEPTVAATKATLVKNVARSTRARGDGGDGGTTSTTPKAARAPETRAPERGAASPRKAVSSAKPGKTPRKRRADAGEDASPAEPLLDALHPMLATLVDAPFDDDGWVFEVKWDGFRALATIHDDGRVDLVSRTGKDFLTEFPTLVNLAEGFRASGIVVDGEIVTLDEEGKSSFQRLQQRLGTHPPRITYVAFDLLGQGGEDLRPLPLEERKARLEKIVRHGSRDVLYSKHVPREGVALFHEAEARGLEGIIGKKRDAPYEGKRSRAWVKLKAQKNQECLVVGFTAPAGSRKDFGALILATYEKGKLVYCGNVGTGFTRTSLAAIHAKMKPLIVETCPLEVRPKLRFPSRGVTWVVPKLVAQVRFTEWTDDGSLRHPAFLGLRDDKKPHDVHRERETPANAIEETER